MPHITKEILSSTEDFKITYYEQASSDILVVTFAGINSDISEKGHGTDFCLKKGFDALHISQKKHTFYQGLSRQQLNEILGLNAHYNHNVNFKYKYVVLYGHSLGGYAALYYSPVFHAPRVIVTSPRCSIHPSIKKNNSYFQKYVHKLSIDHVHKDTVILYDDKNHTDVKFIHDFMGGKAPGVTYVKLSHAGHRIPKVLSEEKILSPFVYDFIKNKIVLDINLENNSTVRLGIKNDEFKSSLKNKDFIMAKKLLDECFALGNGVKQIKMAKAYILSSQEPYPIPILSDAERKKKLSSVTSIVKEGISLSDFYRDLAVVYENIGDFHTALKLINSAYLFKPNGAMINKLKEDYDNIVRLQDLIVDKRNNLEV